MSSYKYREGRFFNYVAAFQSETYSPRLFLNKTARHLKVENDSQLAKALELSHPSISKIRNQHAPITAHILLRVIEATGWTVAEARAAMRA